MRPKPAHHFVANHEDAVLVAELAHALEVAVRRHEHAVGARHRFENERGNGLRAFELDDLLERRQASIGRVPAPFDAVVRIEKMDHARHPRFVGPAPGIAGQRAGAGGRAVIRAVAREDLVASGGQPRELDRVFVRLGAAVGEEEDVDVAGRDLGESFAPSRARGSVAMNGLA